MMRRQAARRFVTRFRELVMSRLSISCAILAVSLLTACGLEVTPPTTNSRLDPVPASAGSVFGGDGIDLLKPFSGTPNQGGGGGIGVNSFLWRASLDTLSFMPLASADPFGGVIITDWYSPPEALDERFKVNIFILDRQLRSDGLRAAVFHQKRGPGGDWLDAPVEGQTQIDLENTILTRARQLRVSTTAQK
jgi:hypothetical protein